MHSFYYFQQKAAAVFKFSRKTIDRKEMFIETGSGSVRVLCYGFNNSGTQPVYFDMHGGGFVLGSPEMDEKMNLRIASESGCKVISIDYYKAPDYPFPTAIYQIYDVIEFFINMADEYGIDENRIAVGGHSAGGNLAAAVSMLVKERGKFSIKCQILDYPPMDLFQNPFEKPQPKGCIPPKLAIMFNDAYVSDEESRTPMASPVLGKKSDLENLPPALVIVAGQDSLCREGISFISKLRDANVDVEDHIYESALHGFTLKDSIETTDAVNKMCGFLKKHLWLIGLHC